MAFVRLAQGSHLATGLQGLHLGTSGAARYCSLTVADAANLRKRVRKDTKLFVPEDQPYPYIYPNGTLYNGKRLDDAAMFEPVIVHNQILEDRIEAFEKDRKAGKFPELDVKPPPIGEWNPEFSVRTGLVGIKLKMYRFWDEHGNAMPVTALWVPNCQVVDIRYPAKHGFWGMRIGCGWPYRRYGSISELEKAYYNKIGMEHKAVTRQFATTEDAILPVGHRLTVRHFKVGQFVDITGKSKGKGFQGVMKRWGFRGGPASHGASLFHRRPGSIGSIKGVVHKHKKMPGHQGDQPDHQMNRYVYMIDFKNDIMYLHGHVPGDAGTYVKIMDSLRKPPQDPPFPTFLPPPGEDIASMSFGECQLTAPPLYKHNRDFPYPSEK